MKSLALLRSVVRGSEHHYVAKIKDVSMALGAAIPRSFSGTMTAVLINMAIFIGLRGAEVLSHAHGKAYAL